MINLPILQSLHIKGYGLFPGTDPERPALHIQFKPGLTLVLGTNGIGKTTLVTILYRMLTGPFDIPNLDNRTALGTASLDVASLNAYRSRTFAARVSDNAMQASVELLFTVNDIRVSVIRNLLNLGLQSCTVDESTAIGEEDRYQKEMAKLANVSSFGDWLLILRYIIFYFEDRNSLVWDPSAQRQLLRVLFLEPQFAKHWRDEERDILERDNHVRNLRATTTREARSLARNESRATNEPRIRQELQSLDERQRMDSQSLDTIADSLADLEAHREESRHWQLTLEQRMD